jgi:hypothetical protein
VFPPAPPPPSLSPSLPSLSPSLPSLSLSLPLSPSPSLPLSRPLSLSTLDFGSNCGGGMQQQSAQEVVAWVNSRLPPAPAPATSGPAPARQESASEPLVIPPEVLATSAALRVPIDLVEGVHFSFSSSFPEVLVQQGYSNLQSSNPNLQNLAMRAGRVGAPHLDPEPSSAAASPEPEAIWPWGG